MDREEQKKILKNYININRTGPEVEAIKGLLEDTKILDWIYAPYIGYVNFSVFTKFCKIILTDKEQ